MQDAQQVIHEAGQFNDEPDRLFGVCLAIASELGFDPFYLRVALIALMVFNPVATIAAYFGLGALVLLAHLIFPKPGLPAAKAEISPPSKDQPMQLAA